MPTLDDALEALDRLAGSPLLGAAHAAATILATLTAQRDELRRRTVDDLEIRGILWPNGGTDAVPAQLGTTDTLAQAIRWLVADRDRLDDELTQAEQQRDDAREQLAHAEETKHDLLPLPALEISAQEIRARALQLAAEHFGGDVYECADELAAYITTGQHPGKDHTDE